MRVLPRAATLIGTVAVAILTGALPTRGQQPFGPAPVRFATIDVLIETDEPLAAWQFELAESNALMTVVGVENGESDAFGDAPYYDLDAVAADRADRIVVADFATGAGAELPVGSTRVATVHVRLTGTREPEYELRLIAAGNASGEPIDAAIRFNAQLGR